MPELKEFTVTSSAKVTKQVNSYEPVTVETVISATYSSNSEEDIDKKTKLLDQKCLHHSARKIQGVFGEKK